MPVAFDSKVHGICINPIMRSKDINLSDFRLLEDSVQVDLLYEKGCYLGKRRADECIILLYQLDSFYAEIYYRRYRRIIQQILCFQSTQFLDPYLQQMDVHELVDCSS